MINSVSDFIAKIGGYAKAAKYFEVSVPAVYNWEARGFPLWSHQRVRDAARRHRVIVADELLEASKPVRKPVAKGKGKGRRVHLRAAAE